MSGRRRSGCKTPPRPVRGTRSGLPTAPAADPIAWGSGVLIPGLDSRAYLIDPLTGRSQAEPFVPKFDRDRQGTWFSPARLDKDTVVLADDVGRVIRLELKTAPVARLVGETERLLDHRIIAGPASTGNAVIVATADRHVRALAARDLSPVGSWALDAPLAGRADRHRRDVLCHGSIRGGHGFLRDGQRTWSIQLDSAVVGAPVVVDQSVWFLTRGGKLHVRASLEWRETRVTGPGRLAERRAAHGGQTGARPGRQGDHPARGRPARGRESSMKKAWERPIP